MVEQTTIKAAINLAHEFGPMFTIAILYLAWEIVKIFFINRKMARSGDIELEEIKNKIGEIQIGMKDKVPYTWVEDRIIPKLDKIHDDLSISNTELKLLSGRVHSLEIKTR